MQSIMRGMIDALMEFCYPARCAACDQAVEGAGPLCDECEQELLALERRAACPRCGAPLAGEAAPCPYCLGAGIAHYRAVARLGTFSEPLKDLIHKAKYRGRWPLAERLAERLLHQPRARRVIEGADCLVPVPLHPFRQIGRGYNQAAVMAQRIGRLCGMVVASAAVRVRHTPTQTHLHSRQQRERNLRDAFALADAALLSGRRVVVIDDVMTTGATLRSLGRVLKQAKPASLSAVVLAVADPRGRDFQLVRAKAGMNNGRR